MSRLETEAGVCLIAGGGHGRVVLDALLASGARVVGVVDPALRVGDCVFGVTVLGGDEWISGAQADNLMLANGVGAQPGIHSRTAIFDKWKSLGFRFAGVAHPTAFVGRDCVLGEGSQIMVGAVLQCGVSIGANSVVNTRVSIDHDCRIGKHAFVGPGAVLCGEVQVGDQAFIGAGAIILPGMRIGQGAVVGAGAVVNRNVPEGCKVAGNPAKQMGREYI